MFRKILCPVDGTEHAMRALERAVALAVAWGATLTICTVNVAQAAGQGPMSPLWTEGQVAVILGQAKSLAQVLGHAGVATVLVVAREAAPAIVQIAESEHADCIVMGTGDRNVPPGLRLGSVAVEVTGRARCSVLVAR